MTARKTDPKRHRKPPIEHARDCPANRKYDNSHSPCRKGSCPNWKAKARTEGGLTCPSGTVTVVSGRGVRVERAAPLPICGRCANDIEQGDTNGLGGCGRCEDGLPRCACCLEIHVAVCAS